MNDIKPVRQTSLMAYYQATENLGQKQLSVLKAIDVLGVCNDKMIADYLNWSINRVTPRRGELRSLGLIKEMGIRKDSDTGRKTIFYGRIKK